MKGDTQPVSGSFRDPAGVVYRRLGRIHRQLHAAAQPAWDALEASGLLEELMEAGLLVRHEDVGLEHALDDRARKVIRPDEVPFISHPYEWSVAQRVDAALLTLDIQARAIAKGFTLRDASAFNVQFVRGRAIFIDTLSLGPWEEGTPWAGYQQFCRHFLGPIALGRFVGPQAAHLSRLHMDGPPLPLVSRMLPLRTWLSFGLLTHLHLHARASVRHGDSGASGARKATLGRQAMLGMVDSLRSTITRLDRSPSGTEWSDYYSATNYSDVATQQKEALVGEALDRLAEHGALHQVWDLGANTGRYSRVAASRADHVVAFDIDEGAVDAHWRELRRQSTPGAVLPLVQDLTNPSPALGWAHEERASLADRGPVDAVLALALIHHLALSNNTPLDRIAAFLARLGRGAVVEMVPKSDSQVKRLLATREDIFPGYTVDGFEEAFTGPFEILHKAPVPGTERILYTLKRTS